MPKFHKIFILASGIVVLCELNWPNSAVLTVLKNLNSKSGFENLQLHSREER